MTGPIKPPGSPKTPGISPTDGPTADKAGRSQENAEAFQAALSTNESSASSATAASPVESITSELEAGRIDGTEAVERLIATALEGPMAAQLDEAGRAALEEHLRSTLADDPNLAAMVADLDGNR